MPWQHYIIAAEVTISALLALKYIERGGYVMGKVRGTFWAASDAAMAGLLIWGATHFAWQYLLIGAIYLLGVWRNLLVGWTRPAFRELKAGRPGALTPAIALGGLVCFKVALLSTGAWA